MTIGKWWGHGGGRGHDGHSNGKGHYDHGKGWGWGHVEKCGWSGWGWGGGRGHDGHSNGKGHHDHGKGWGWGHRESDCCGEENVIADTDGADCLNGTSAKDIFVLGEDGQKDVIKDFRDGCDLIRIESCDIEGFEDIEIRDAGCGWIKITYGDEELLVSGTSGCGRLRACDLTAKDFEFVCDKPAVTVVLDFEELLSDRAAVLSLPEGYGGLTWSDSTNYVQVSSYESILAFENQGHPGPAFSGLGNDPTPSDIVIANAEGTDMLSFSRADSFDFESVEIGSLFHADVEVTITGSRGGVTTGSQVVTVGTTGGVIELDDAIFDSVDSVVFAITDPGTSDPALVSRPDTQIYLDDLTIIG